MRVTIPSELLAQAREFSRSDESLAAFLKRAGLSKSLSAIAFAHVAGVSPADAKRVIHNSDAWAEARGRDEVLHTDAIRALG
jgi:MoxR-like ATPase